MELDILIDYLIRYREFDLSGYSKSTLTRRTAYFMGIYGITSVQELADKLVRDNTLFQDFLDKLTINVTEFFRDPCAWTELVKLLAPFRSKSLSAWSAGCSVGCEPYTLAMVLKENGFSARRILATDIDKVALQRAREGIYELKEVKRVPPPYMKYFSKVGDRYAVVESIKKMVTFRHQNLLKDDFPQEEMDLILFRNVVIYFNQESHELLWGKFSKALKPGGLLFVGGSEVIFDPKKYDLKLLSHGFYRRV
ncbi:protein-glutamate O-methyltransferase CheR [Coprothermobacteraceae bacterium]|nr:protein-glutamate O-methyltransferase CheR [Coprothermobacteraceae bacterium]